MGCTGRVQDEIGACRQRGGEKRLTRFHIEGPGQKISSHRSAQVELKMAREYSELPMFHPTWRDLFGQIQSLKALLRSTHALIDMTASPSCRRWAHLSPPLSISFYPTSPHLASHDISIHVLVDIATGGLSLLFCQVSVYCSPHLQVV